MSEDKPYTIDKVSWHTTVEGNPEDGDSIRMRFRIVTDYLQRNALTVRTLLRPGEEPSEDFAIRTTDLTAEGLEVMKKAYDKWLKKVVNKRKDLTDLRIFEKALSEIRER